MVSKPKSGMTASTKTSPSALAKAFATAYRAELDQRTDAGVSGASAAAPEAVLWAAAHASRAVLAERWARTQAAAQ